MAKFLVLAVLGLMALSQVSGHGRLLNPAGRSTLWRYAEFQRFNPYQNYQDNELFCGGFHIQMENGDRCGECGDPWHEPRPRANEGGGRFGRGIITGTYTEGQVISVTVELTSNHKGYFEYRICPHNNPLVPADQECLDQYLLEYADGSGTKTPITGSYTGPITAELRLPAGLTCTQCVFQWHYKTGNSWGDCGDGTGAIGCGSQETFRGCADIRINPAE